MLENHMIACIRTAAHCPVTIFAGIFAASAGALCGALYAQFALHLDPCILCLYQRMPYIAAMVLAVIGLALRKNTKAVKVLVGLSALAFLTDCAIAVYHTGVERHWWESAAEGCSAPNFAKDPSLLQKILTTPAAHCSDIAWADSFFGLTMANYNVAFSLMLFAGCVFTLMQRGAPSKAP